MKSVPLKGRAEREKIMNNKYKILVIEDDENISAFVRAVLESNNYQVLTAVSCTQGELVFSSYIPDLVILDLGLPDKDGSEFIKYARDSSAVPIIVLSARTAESDKVAALDLGANDYIIKPFGTEEMLARVRAALRSVRIGGAGVSELGNRFTLKNLEIDYDKRIVTVEGNNVKLTQTEYNILSYLSRHTGKMLTYGSIISAVWGNMDYGCIKKLQVNMANIRKKLGEKPGEARYITNELGVGYRMLDEDE